ncbi:MAG: hypothetical protein SNJ74_02220 [Fimbriimonadaceae bacterium]
MRTFPSTLCAILGFGLVVACGGPADQTAPVATEAKPAPIEDTAQQALLPRMSEVARTSPAGWTTLTSEQRAPFLEFHSGNEERARTHYETLVETEREVQQNLGR